MTLSFFTPAIGTLLIIVGVGGFVMWLFVCGLPLLMDIFRDMWGSR